MLDSSIVTHFQFSRCLWDAKCLESCKDLLKTKCLLQLSCWISSLFPANKAKPCVVPQTAFTMTSLPLSSLRNHFWMGVRPHTITAKEISDTCTAIPETAQSGFAMTLGQIIYSFVGIYWPEVARHAFPVNSHLWCLCAQISAYLIERAWHIRKWLPCMETFVALEK